MEDGQGPYILEEEVRGLSINEEETMSNGHRERMESLELVETIRRLKMEVQSCRVDNERMLKAVEKQNQLNTQLLQSINHLQRQMKNGSGSRYEEGGRVIHDEKTMEDLSTQRHHYSPTHLVRTP